MPAHGLVFFHSSRYVNIGTLKKRLKGRLNMYSVVSRTKAIYTPFFEKGQGGKIFYKDLVLDYKESLVVAIARGVTYRDSPNLKKETYRVPGMFAVADWFIFREQARPELMRVKVRFDFSQLLYCQTGQALVRAKALPLTSTIGVKNLEAMDGARVIGALTSGFLPDMCCNFDLDILKALNVLDDLPIPPVPQEQQLAYVQRIRSAFEHYQCLPARIAPPDQNLPDNLGFFAYAMNQIPCTYIQEALTQLIIA